MAVPPFGDLPLAPADREWDSAAAVKRVREWADAEDEPDAKYRQAFAWYDAEKKDEFTAYTLPYADVVDGHLRAVPRAISSAAANLDGARGGLDIPDADRTKVRALLGKYYDKMGETAPWEK